jgi:hypothetical protein
MVEREPPIHLIRLLWNLLKQKKFVFYVGGIEYKSRTGYKGTLKKKTLLESSNKNFLNEFQVIN